MSLGLGRQNMCHVEGQCLGSQLQWSRPDLHRCPDSGCEGHKVFEWRRPVAPFFHRRQEPSSCADDGDLCGQHTVPGCLRRQIEPEASETIGAPRIVAFRFAKPSSDASAIPMSGVGACEHLTQSLEDPERLHSPSTSHDRLRAVLTTLLAF